MKKRQDDFKPGSNPNPKTPPPPPPGRDKQFGGFPTMPVPGYATCIRVFQNGIKVMEFTAKAMKVVALNKEYITFYNEIGKRTTIYSNDGIIYVKFADREE